ncbi:hypothetical protein DFH08DRAFT_949332 [Mycena albidolilacea]|uniref:Uncharacterized protein n=1 Tax=Mycena albidolilacea TaxID=1033008 RepID=A0AAD7ATW9_9AGAR|nr:hypothetical protein DFH08DRAFT_949332 [Mycena albidolilacea]
MQFIAVLLAAASLAFAQSTVPTVSSYSEAGCAGTALATWSGVPENAFCQATPGAISLSVIPGTNAKCQIDLYSTSNCNVSNGANLGEVPLTNSCFTASKEFASVRILCITTG